MEETDKGLNRGTRLPGLLRMLNTTHSVPCICKKCGEGFHGWACTMLDSQEHKTTWCPTCIQRQRDQDVIERARAELAETDVEQRAAWLAKSGVEGRWLTKTFENFEQARDSRAFDVVKGYSGRSLVLYSPGKGGEPPVYGDGKTHLVSALANHLVATQPAAVFRDRSYMVLRQPCPVLFSTEHRMLGRIRETFNRRDDAGETDERVYRHLAGVPLLIIDDVGKLRPHDISFTQGVYFRVIDDRYSGERPVIMTTNLTLTELEQHIGGASADRLREMCGKEGFIRMAGKSYRR